MTREEEEKALNDAFKAEALAAEKAEKERQENRGKGFTRDYEDLHWSGLEVGVTKVYRLLGIKPDLNMLEGSRPGTKYDGRVVNICRILDDKGKLRRFIIPCNNKDDAHIIWRIIDTVNTHTWVDKNDGSGKKKRNFTFETKFPEIFQLINRNKFPVDDKVFGLKTKGWRGSEFYITNAIDRTNPSFHAEHKHSVLIAKNISTSKGDDNVERTFVEEGVPAFGFTGELNRLFKTYGLPTAYDIGIERTGKQNPSIIVLNASRTPEMCRDNEKYVVNGPLTEEELKYTQYDLDKLFGLTTYTKIYNALNKTIAMIDASLGTHYLSELKSLSDEEKARWDLEKKSNPDQDHEQEEDMEEDTSADFDSEPARTADDYARQHREEEAKAKIEAEPVRHVAREPEEEPARRVAAKPSVVMPPAYEKLSPAEKKEITGATPPANDGDPWVVSYVGNPTPITLPKCPECGTRSPKTFSTCPSCGIQFDFS